MLTVRLDEARVRDEETGVDVMSAAVGDLSAKLFELRAPVWLSDEDAASIALVVPRVATHLTVGCTVGAGVASYSHDAIVSVSCKDGPIRDANVLVNLETGAVTDPMTRKSLDTPETQRIARDRLSDVQRRRSGLKTSLETMCRAR